MSGEPTVLLHLGPDVPSRLALVLGVPVATGFAVLLGFLLEAWTWPLLAILWILALWYLAATATRAFTEVSTAGVTFETALRYCFVPWGEVSDVRQHARITLYLRDGTRVAISQYSLTPISVGLRWPRRQVVDAERLRAAVEEARRLGEQAGPGDPDRDRPSWVHWRARIPWRHRFR
jgi:hypothetical protein